MLKKSVDVPVINICKPNLDREREREIGLNRNQVTHSYDYQAGAVLYLNSSTGGS